MSCQMNSFSGDGAFLVNYTVPAAIIITKGGWWHGMAGSWWLVSTLDNSTELRFYHIAKLKFRCGFIKNEISNKATRQTKEKVFKFFSLNGRNKTRGCFFTGENAVQPGFHGALSGTLLTARWSIINQLIGVDVNLAAKLHSLTAQLNCKNKFSRNWK